MAVGRNGQVIIVCPDLDVVAVTTGRENYRLSEVADSISRSVKSDTSLSADAEGARSCSRTKYSRSQLGSPLKSGRSREMGASRLRKGVQVFPDYLPAGIAG